jgi:hypothetical protein
LFDSITTHIISNIKQLKLSDLINLSDNIQKTTFLVYYDLINLKDTISKSVKVVFNDIITIFEPVRRIDPLIKVILSDIISVNDIMRTRLQHIPEYIKNNIRIYLKPKKFISYIKAIFSKIFPSYN